MFRGDVVVMSVPPRAVGVHDVALAPGEVLTVSFADDLGVVEVVNLDGAAEQSG